MEQWIENIRRQAGDYKRKAPDGLLDDIKKAMQDRPSTIQMREEGANGPRPRNFSRSFGLLPYFGGAERRLRVRRGVAAAAIAAAIALAVIFVFKTAQNNNYPLTANKNTGTQSIKKEQQLNNTNNKYRQSVYINKPGAQSQSNIASLARHIIYNIEEDGKELIAQVTDALSEQEGENTLIAENDAQTAEPLTGTKQQTTAEKQHNSTRPKNWYDGSSLGNTTLAQRHSSFDIAVGYSGMGSASDGTGSNGGMYDAVASSNGYILTMPMAETEMSTSVHHNMPIKAGVSVRYNIGNRWSVQTGVNYSYLSSDIDRSNNTEESHSKQKLHYMSIPLTASYSLWHNEHVNVYLSAGAEAAKLVKGKANVESSTYGQATTNHQEHISEHRLQYSVNGAAGVEYKPNGRLSVYAEPGVAHYFNNHSDVVNIYKDKPTQFTINVGLRINLNK